MGKKITSLEKTFEYFSDLEEYPRRYPKYCARLDIIKKDGNDVYTKEIWNMQPSKDFDHITIKVHYTIVPLKEIKYEVIDGFGAGKVKGSIKFTKRDDGLIQVDEHYILLEILAEFLHDSNHPLVMHVHDHFMWQNMRLLEGKQTPFQSGDICPHCKVGIISYIPKNEKTDEGNKKYETERFQCEKCNKIATNHKIQSNERVNHY